MNCINCYEPIRLTEDRDGIEMHGGEYEYKWVHDDGDPICPIPCVATPPGGTT